MCRSLGLGCSRLLKYFVIITHCMFLRLLCRTGPFWAWQPTLKVLPRVHLGSLRMILTRTTSGTLFFAYAAVFRLVRRPGGAASSMTFVAMRVPNRLVQRARLRPVVANG